MSPSLEHRALRGELGDLISVGILIDPRHLEELLDQLSSVAFPINPELRYCPSEAGKLLTKVEFPAFSSQIQEVIRALHLADLGGTVQLALALPMR